MEKYVCMECGYVYNFKIGDSDNKIKSGTDFKDVPEEWVCTLCAATKEQFKKLK